MMLITFSDIVAMGNIFEQYRQVIGSFHLTGPSLAIKTCRKTQRDSSITSRAVCFSCCSCLAGVGKKSRYSPLNNHSFTGIHFKKSFHSLGYTIQQPCAYQDTLYKTLKLLGYTLEKPSNYQDTCYNLPFIETLQSLKYMLQRPSNH